MARDGTRAGDGARDAEENALLERIASGAADGAMDALHGRYAASLNALGLRLLREHGLAEELVQETLVRVWRSASAFDPRRGSARTFIFTIARRTAVDLQRRRGMRPLGLLSDEALGEADPRLGAVEDTGEGLLISLDLQRAVARLSRPHREVIALSYDLDLTQREVAARLDLPLGTVKTRSQSALQTLRRDLAETGEVA